MMNWQQVLLNILWCVVSILLIIGFTSPMFTFSQFYFFNDTFSLIKGIVHLARQGEFILFFLLMTFSILMPIIKMILLFYTINAPTMFNHIQQQRLDKLAHVSKWSMLDVYVVAILAVSIKLGMIATVHIHFGLIAFAVSVVLSMFLTWLISHFYGISDRDKHIKISQVKHKKLYEPLTITLTLTTHEIAKLRTDGTLEINDILCNDVTLIDIVNEEGIWCEKTQYNKKETPSLSLITHIK